MIKRLVRRAINSFGYNLVRYHPADSTYPGDFSKEQVEVIELVRPYTTTSPERIAALVSAVTYITENRIEGDFVECGVWRGGSIMAGLYTLLRLGDTSRTIYLFDTFAGMTEPSERDYTLTGESAGELLRKTPRKTSHKPGVWCWATVEDVTKNLRATGYPMERIRLVKGDVMDTIPDKAPGKIALLRLDTDWYQSTKHDLNHLFPRLSEEGVLIIDDYGYWKGAREAVDEFFGSQSHKPLLHRIDYTGRIVIKK
jgi:O-methyltransferase